MFKCVDVVGSVVDRIWIWFSCSWFETGLTRQCETWSILTKSWDLPLTHKTMKNEHVQSLELFIIALVCMCIGFLYWWTCDLNHSFTSLALTTVIWMYFCFVGDYLTWLWVCVWSPLGLCPSLEWQVVSQSHCVANSLEFAFVVTGCFGFVCYL